jgi:hypothetical protein
MTIVRITGLQVLQCVCCDEVFEYTRATAANPEAMAMLVERVTDDHQDCAQWSHDPERAKRERGVKLRMRREFRKRQCSRRLF